MQTRLLHQRPVPALRDRQDGVQFDSLLLIPNPQGRPSCMPAEHTPSGLTRRVVWRVAFALLLVTGWAWQARRRLGVVDLYPTTPTARPGAAPRVRPAALRSAAAESLYATA